VLGEIGASHIPELLVFNKSDAAPEIAKELVQQHEGSVSVSALTGEGIDCFLHALSDRLRALSKIIELLIPYDRGDLLAALHREGEVLTTRHDEGGVRVRARLADASAGRLAQFAVAPA
jgi:GTP-binding protein HflX